MKNQFCSRRDFLRRSSAFAASASLSSTFGPLVFAEELKPKIISAARRADAKVSIVACKAYELGTVREAMAKSFDLLGGIGSLVKNKTVTVKLNLTGTVFESFLGRPVGETFMTHYSTVLALGSLVFAGGAKRIRLVESTQSKPELERTLAVAGWDVKALDALGKVEYENTRNLGKGKTYAHLKVPNGHMFSSFDLNHAYDETDVMISLAKLKNHVTAGVTLSMKNLFGITPNSLYGGQAGSEDATDGRGPLHNPMGFEHIKLPGLKEGITKTDPTWRVPRITADICAARPIHLAIIDGITAMSGGEGPWCSRAAPLKFTSPGVLIAGLNPVSADAIGAFVMGYDDPRALRGVKPFVRCDNHLLLAEEAGVGVADLKQIDVRGLAIEKARYPYG